MATEIILPKLGMNMESATILSWLRQEGDVVAVGDVLAEVETDKAVVELEAEVAGIVRRVLAGEGDRIGVNEVVAVIGSADEDISELIERITNAAPVATSHVQEIYRSWTAPLPAQAVTTAGNGQHASNGAVSAPTAAPSTGKLDPDAIRERLMHRGVLSGGPDQLSKAPTTRLVIYGSGLGAKQILEVTRHLDDIKVIGLIDDNPDLLGVKLGGAQVIGGFNALAELVARGEIDGVALSFHSEVRKRVHERIKTELDVRIVPLVDPRAMIGMDVTIEDGALVEAGAVIGPGTVIGEGTIVDVGAIIAHDCLLGPFSHLSPGCVLSGVVCLRENVLVGVGAALNSTITVEGGVIVTPGSAVMNDVPADVVVSGVPAKIIGKSRRNR